MTEKEKEGETEEGNGKFKRFAKKSRKRKCKEDAKDGTDADTGRTTGDNSRRLAIRLDTAGNGNIRCLSLKFFKSFF